MSEQSKNSNRLAPVKRETGANPVRTRHRDREQEPQNHWETGKMADAGRISSFILWGPPGVGKTTLAQIIANKLETPFWSEENFEAIRSTRSP